MRDRALGATIRIFFDTSQSGGDNVAPSAAFTASDVRIYKDGSATEKTTTNGLSMTSPFDSTTGLHLLEIDTSNSTGDAGFWSSGSMYSVVLNTAKTVDGKSVTGKRIGDFSIELQTADIRKAGGTAITQSGGRMEVNATHWGGTAVGSANVLIDGAITANKIATDAITAAKIAADAIAEIQAELSTLDAAAVRAALGLASANMDTQLAGISTKTTNLPTDPADASDIAAAFATVNSTLATIAGYLDTEIAAIKAKTDTLPALPASETTLTALSGKLAGITLLRNWLAVIMGKAADTATRAEVNATTAGATYNETTDSLEAIRDRGDAAWTTGSGGGGGGSGTGARTVTITVNDGTTALQNATVRLTEGANTFTAQTNVSGVATFNVDDATYTVAITKAGYSYSGTTLVVNGTEAETYSMTAITITPSTGDQTTGFLTTLDETGAAEAGVSIYVSVADVPNDYGLALDEATRTVVSDEDGLVEITGMVKGATYNLRRGLKGRLYPVTIPTSAGSTYELPNMAGV